MTPKMIHVETPVIEERANPQHHTDTRSRKIFISTCSQDIPDAASAKANTGILHCVQDDGAKKGCGHIRGSITRL
jgi:hypothetical protein